MSEYSGFVETKPGISISNFDKAHMYNEVVNTSINSNKEQRKQQHKSQQQHQLPQQQQHSSATIIGDVTVITVGSPSSRRKLSYDPTWPTILCHSLRHQLRSKMAAGSKVCGLWPHRKKLNLRFFFLSVQLSL